MEGRAEQKARTRSWRRSWTRCWTIRGQVREIVKGIGDKSLAQRIQRDALTRKARAKREVTEEFRATVVAHNTGADKGDPNGGQGCSDAGEGGETLAARVAAVKAGDTVTVKSLGRQARVERVFEGKGAGGGGSLRYRRG